MKRGMKGKSVVSAKLEMSPIRFERAFIVVFSVQEQL
jgi:hypothetical protein